MSSAKTEQMQLKGHLLVAMPGMQDPRFARSVVFICAHSDEGSMGFILNQPVASPSFAEILEELEMPEEGIVQAKADAIRVFRGGPVEQGRGFVLHTLDYGTTSSTRVDDLAGITATMDALRRIASADAPQGHVLFLGYAGWSSGQLEEEILHNGWLTLPATRDILFNTPSDRQYEAALACLGISEELLSANPGHA
ncbi:MAG: YqgE/AlgH family protein [Rhizobiaceae bacterium]